MTCAHLRTCCVLLAGGLAPLAASCTKEVDDPTFPPEPTLVLEAQSDIELAAFADTLRLTLGYTDGDGDLGDVASGSGLYVLDRRLREPDVYALQRLTPDGEPLSIAGTFRLALGPYFVLGNAPAETFELELWLVDRAGNESPRIITSPITVRRP